MRSALPFAPAIALLSATAGAQAPPGYYNSVVTTSQAQLRATLHAVIDDHSRFPYSSGGTDTWDILEVADQDPTNSSRILDLYKNAVWTKQGGGNSFYNREHTWPNSYGFPVDGGNNYPYTDCHQLFLCDIAYNGSRGNLVFATGNASWTRYATDVNGGVGGGTSAYPGASNWGSASGWEVWSGRKGDVARALLYLDVRYEGGVHGGTGAAEPDLILTDNLTLIANSATGNNESVAYMGKLSVLLQWHQQDPVDAKEIARNNAVFSYQGNRNPFIDHPEWVDCVFLGTCSTTGGNGREPEIWINELHYDNSGVDVGEFVEIAGPAGENVDGWLLVGYDGATGHAYGYKRLSGTFANQQNGLGTLSFAFTGLQDGPDGVALVTSNGAVMHFVCYEGAVTAIGGAADGMAATDIGVSETSSSPQGFALRLTGAGSRYSQFTWSTIAVATPGAVNVGQSFQ